MKAKLANGTIMVSEANVGMDRRTHLELTNIFKYITTMTVKTVDRWISTSMKSFETISVHDREINTYKKYSLDINFEQLKDAAVFARMYHLSTLQKVVNAQLWLAAPDFKSLCELNKGFLQGLCDETPYHCGPVFKETLPLLPKLFNLHSFEVLTVESQPYETGKLSEEQYNSRPPGEKGSPWSVFAGSKSWYEYQQIPYLKFYVDGSNRPEALFTLLKQVPMLYVAASAVYRTDVFTGSDLWTIPLNRTRTAPSEDDLSRQGWSHEDEETEKVYIPANGDVLEDFENYYMAMRQHDVIYFHVSVRKWVDFDLVGKVLEVVKCWSATE